MLDFFVNFFTDIFNLVMILLFALIGVFIGLVFRPKAKDQVMKIIPRDRRFQDFNVAQENAFSVECENVKGFPPQRFVKLRPGFTGKVGRFIKKAITRYIGIEGTAYTQLIESGKKELGTLADALRGLWGLKFYNTVPEDKRRELEESKINVIVEINPEFNPEDFPEISEEDIFDEEDRKGAETYWQGKKQSEKGEWTKQIWLLVAGAGILAIASKLLGWW